MKDVGRIVLVGSAVFTIWVTSVQAQEPFNALFAEGYDFLSKNKSSYSAEVSPRQSVKGSVSHTLFGEGYAALERHEQVTSDLKAVPEGEAGTLPTPFHTIFGEGYDFASLGSNSKP